MAKRTTVLLVVVAMVMAMVSTTSGATEARATRCFGMTPTIWGTNASETIYGTNGNDVIWAGGGNDTVYASGGNDRICGKGGNDYLYGGTGDDRLAGNGGDDVLYGEEGNDLLRGGGGNDELSGIPGTDIDLAGRGPADHCDLGDDDFGGCEIWFGTPETTPPPPPPPPPTGGTLDFTLPANQSLTLAEGWGGADPRTFSITSGGSISTSYLNSLSSHATGDCTGYAIENPDFEFIYTDGPVTQTHLRFFWKPNSPGSPNGTGDAVLIINGPDGKWYCNDDFAGLNPQLTFPGGMTGTYDVWVASRVSGGGAGGTLSITELNINVTP